MTNEAGNNTAKTPNETTIVVADVKLIVIYPANAELPDSVTRLLKGLTRKLEEWARERIPVIEN